MAVQKNKLSIWQALIQRSFLSLFQVDYQRLAEHNFLKGYDFVFEFDEAIIYVVVKSLAMRVKIHQISKSQVDSLKRQTANQLIKHHHQLYNRYLQNNQITNGFAEPTLSNQNNLQQKNQPHKKPTFFVGLTALSVEYQNKLYPLEHDYSSDFFIEECVLDLDDSNRILQIFSFNSFEQIIGQLTSPSDFAAFLNFHRPFLAEQHRYPDGVFLLKQFLRSAQYYKRAITIEEKLVRIGLLDQVEPRLFKAIAPDQLVFNQKLGAELYKNSLMWYKLVNGTSKRRFERGKKLPVDQVKMLIDESMYTRSCIIEEIMAYAKAPNEEKISGYLRHQHSYNNFGRHYMIIFYSLDKTSELSKEYVAAHHQDFLFDVNVQLQNPVMEDLFLLGIEFNHHQISGQSEVIMDVYHQAGCELTAGMQLLYEQLADLKDQS